jgi:hypothetical protein
MSQGTEIAAPGRGIETIDLTWSRLCTIGGAAALICAVMYLITLAVYIPALLPRFGRHHHHDSLGSHVSGSIQCAQRVE